MDDWNHQTTNAGKKITNIWNIVALAAALSLSNIDSSIDGDIY